MDLAIFERIQGTCLMNPCGIKLKAYDPLLSVLSIIDFNCMNQWNTIFINLDYLCQFSLASITMFFSAGYTLWNFASGHVVIFKL